MARLTFHYFKHVSMSILDGALTMHDYFVIVFSDLRAQANNKKKWTKKFEPLRFGEVNGILMNLW